MSSDVRANSHGLLPPPHDYQFPEGSNRVAVNFQPLCLVRHVEQSKPLLSTCGVNDLKNEQTYNKLNFYWRKLTYLRKTGFDNVPGLGACFHWGQLGEGYLGTLYAIFVMSLSLKIFKI